MQENTIYQVSTAQNLMNGKAEGEYTINHLLQFGDFGIGAVNHYNGELIINQKQAFIANYLCKIIAPLVNEKTPFTIITTFKPGTELNIQTKSKDELYEFFKNKLNLENQIFAIKIKGNFNQVIIRSGKKQEKPYTDFKEIIKNSTTVIKNNIQGTMIGFYFPKSFNEISTSGFHFHFIDNKEETGGHVFDFYIENAETFIEKKSTINIILPD